MNLKKVLSTNVEHQMDAELWLKSGHCELKEELNKSLKFNLGKLFGGSPGTVSGESSAFFPKKHVSMTER